MSENKQIKPYGENTKLGFSILFLVCLAILGLAVSFSETWRGVLGAVIFVAIPVVAVIQAVNSDRWQDSKS